MVAFRYKALDASGSPTEGQIQANSLQAAEDKLHEKRLTPLYLVQVGGAPTASATKSESPSLQAVNGGSPLSIGGPRRAKPEEVTDALRSMEVMLRAGVPLAESLDTLIENAPGAAIRTMADRMKTSVMEGKSLGESMRQFPDMFPEAVCQMVGVADEGGQLGNALEAGRKFLEQRAHTAKTVKGALVYPIMLMFICTGTMLFFLLFIMPTFGKTFEGMQIKLPITTVVLLALGDFLSKNMMLVMGGTIGLVAGGMFALRVPTIRAAVERFTYRIPLVGAIGRDLAMARTVRTLASLVSTNLPIIPAIDQSGRVAGWPRLADAMASVKDAVERGETLARALADTKVFPAMIVQLVSVGERSGQLAPLLGTASEQLQDRAERKLKGVLSLLEPAFIVIMGLVIGLMTLSILMPLFALNQGIK
jgi:type II secretory pathway component PulF